MVLETTQFNFERTLHESATSYEDLLAYQQAANHFLQYETVSVPNRIKWNREFKHKQYTLTSSENFLDIWVPTEGFLSFDSGLRFQDDSGCFLIQDGGELVIFEE